MGTRKYFLRPEDHSVEAYRDWILFIAERLTGKKAEDDQTMEEWKADCEHFWKGDDVEEPEEDEDTP